jgi:hypothetical protein
VAPLPASVSRASRCSSQSRQLLRGTRGRPVGAQRRPLPPRGRAGRGPRRRQPRPSS